jgi:hypothetical protein
MAQFWDISSDGSLLGHPLHDVVHFWTLLPAHPWFAGILLQLFKFGFDRIGSLPSPNTGFSASVRLFTFKVHNIVRTGGVNTFGTLGYNDFQLFSSYSAQILTSHGLWK